MSIEACSVKTTEKPDGGRRRKATWKVERQRRQCRGRDIKTDANQTDRWSLRRLERLSASMGFWEHEEETVETVVYCRVELCSRRSG
ncbi:uncharacterized, partial [Tachysurus ichikawai]